MQLPRLFVKEPAKAATVAAGGAAHAAGTRAAKPVAARAKLEGKKRLLEGAT